MQFIEGRTLAEVLKELREGSRQNSQMAAPTQDVAASNTPRPESPPSPGPEAAFSAAAGLSGETSTASPAYFRRVAELGIQAAEALGKNMLTRSV